MRRTINRLLISKNHHPLLPPPVPESPELDVVELDELLDDEEELLDDDELDEGVASILRTSMELSTPA